MINENELQSVNGVIVIPQDLPLYSGLIPILVNKISGDPVITWKGAKIPAELWAQIVSFMRWTYEKYSSEAQLRLFYNEVSNTWGVAVFPQTVGTGMISKEIEPHAGRDELFKQFDSTLGWRECGTVHHHCSTSAFQSGTDKADEMQKNGLHVTLGGMGDKTEHGFHARVTFRGVMYGLVPSQWIDAEVDTTNQYSARVRTSTAVFPESWKLYLVEQPKPKPYVYTYDPKSNYTGYRHITGYGSHDDDSYYGDYGGAAYGRFHYEHKGTASGVRTDYMKQVIANFELIHDKLLQKLGFMDADTYRDYIGTLRECHSSLQSLKLLDKGGLFMEEGEIIETFLQDLWIVTQDEEVQEIIDSGRVQFSMEMVTGIYGDMLDLDPSMDSAQLRAAREANEALSVSGDCLSTTGASPDHAPVGS